MHLDVWLAFVAATVILLVMPGPTTLAIISYSMANGRRAKLPLMAAIALGDSTGLGVSLLGLGALLAASAFWFTAVKWAGGLYLIYLGVRMLRAGVSPAELAAVNGPVSRWRIFANTYLVTALNPKGIVFFVAFLPQFISPDLPAHPQMWMLAATFVTLSATTATVYTLFASAARDFVSSAAAQRRFNLAGGSLLSVAGVWALFAKRSA